jgi:hypothetical protein
MRWGFIMDCERYCGIAAVSEGFLNMGLASTAFKAAFLVCFLSLVGCSNGGGGGTCTGASVSGACDGGGCGGDPTGTWRLVGLCAPSCVVSVAQVLCYTADGKYGYHQSADAGCAGVDAQSAGTWEIKDGSLYNTVSGVSSGAEYCITGDRMWARRYTNCGSEGGLMTTVYKRDCSGL